MKKFAAYLLLFIAFLYANKTDAAVFPIAKDSNHIASAKKETTFFKVDKKDLETKLGRRLKGKEKIVLWLYNHKLLKPKGGDTDEEKAIKWGQASLITGLIGWGLILFGTLLTIPFLGGISFLLFIFSLIYGIKSIHKKKKNNPKAVFGIVLSGLYFLILLLAIALVVLLIGGL